MQQVVKPCRSLRPSNALDKRRYLRGLGTDNSEDITAVLSSLDELPLPDVQPRTAAVYRFGDVHYDAIRTIRIETDGERCVAVTTFRANRGDNCWSQSLRTSVSEPGCAEILSCLRDADFWDVPYHQTERQSPVFDDAGARLVSIHEAPGYWWIEGRNQDRFHIVLSSGSPGDQGTTQPAVGRCAITWMTMLERLSGKRLLDIVRGY